MKDKEARELIAVTQAQLLDIVKLARKYCERCVAMSEYLGIHFERTPAAESKLIAKKREKK